MFYKVLGSGLLILAAWRTERYMTRRGRGSIERLGAFLQLLSLLGREVTEVGRPIGEILRMVPERIWRLCVGEGTGERTWEHLRRGAASLADAPGRRLLLAFFAVPPGASRTEFLARLRNASTGAEERYAALAREVPRECKNIRVLIYSILAMTLILLW